MPQVFEVRQVSEEEKSLNHFDTTFDGGLPFAFDILHQSAGSVLDTTISCHLTADLTEYGPMSGTLQFAVVFDAGARLVTIDAGNCWETGINTIIFHSDLVQTVELL